MLFGEKLRLLRKSRGLSQTDLANLIGTTKRTILCYENNHFYPRDRETYTKLATALMCDEYYLKSEEDELSTDVPKYISPDLYDTYVEILNLLYIFDSEEMKFSFDLVSGYFEISEYTLMRAIEYWERLNYLTIKEVNGNMQFYVTKIPKLRVKKAS